MSLENASENQEIDRHVRAKHMHQNAYLKSLFNHARNSNTSNIIHTNIEIKR